MCIRDSNLTPRYHGCSNSTSVDHSMSMETPPTSFYDRPGSIFGKCFWSGDETTVGAKIDRAPSTTVVLSWLSGAGTSQEVWSLIWYHSPALPTSPSYITLQRLLWRTTPSPRQTFKWTLPDQDNWDIVGTTRCCAAHVCWWCITWPLGTMGAPTPLVWTNPRPWRPPNIILRSSREHFWEIFRIRKWDEHGNESRRALIECGCSASVKR